MPNKYNPEYYQYRRKMRINRRLCLVCGHPLNDNEGRTCEECLQKRRKKRKSQNKMQGV
ncbi:MAG: hypothetical protein K2K57_03015 [Oscillospiraceae bacterium]|nr:hypothetical protein [Oscillospiraceae bacterium]